MPTPDPTDRPDIAIGHHPDHGITAAVPHRLAAADRMLDGLGFHPVHDHPGLYTLTHPGPSPDATAHATLAVTLLRRAGYTVATDLAYEPEPAPLDAPRPTLADGAFAPDVAIAEHPSLGIIAATADGPGHGDELLAAHGWRHHPRLGIHTLPARTRQDALATAARTTLALHHAGYLTTVEPHLAHDLTQHRPTTAPAPAPAPSLATPAADPRPVLDQFRRSR
jgi:hypothetical protein